MKTVGKDKAVKLGLSCCPTGHEQWYTDLVKESKAARKQVKTERTNRRLAR